MCTSAPLDIWTLSVMQWDSIETYRIEMFVYIYKLSWTCTTLILGVCLSSSFIVPLSVYLFCLCVVFIYLCMGLSVCVCVCVCV